MQRQLPAQGARSQSVSVRMFEITGDVLQALYTLNMPIHDDTVQIYAGPQHER